MRQDKWFIIKNDYQYDILVSIAQTNEQFWKVIQKFNIKYSEQEIRLVEKYKDRMGYCAFTDDNQTIIRLKCPPTNAKWRGILSHEVLHAASFILEAMGVKFSEDSEEVYAYFIQHITEQIYKHYDSRRKM